MVPKKRYFLILKLYFLGTTYSFI